MERVDTYYKYLGVGFDSKLNWKENINSVLNNVNLGMYCRRKLRSSGVNSDNFYASNFLNVVICSLIVFGSVCWSGNISKFDSGRLENIVKKKKIKKELVIL